MEMEAYNRRESMDCAEVHPTGCIAVRRIHEHGSTQSKGIPATQGKQPAFEPYLFDPADVMPTRIAACNTARAPLRSSAGAAAGGCRLLLRPCFTKPGTATRRATESDDASALSEEYTTTMQEKMGSPRCGGDCCDRRASRFCKSRGHKLKSSTLPAA